MEIDAWHLWLLAGIVLAALEMLGLAFVALALALSCCIGRRLSDHANCR